MTTLSDCKKEEGAEIVRCDALGRARSTPEQRAALVTEYERSGMTVAAFARWSGVRYPTVASWVTKARGRGRSLGGQ